MDQHHVTPRLRADGTFDTAYYMQRSRQMRSDQAFSLFGALRSLIPRRIRRNQARTAW